jgi:hypothetical protein
VAIAVAQEVQGQDPNFSTNGTTIAATLTLAAGSYLHVMAFGNGAVGMTASISDGVNTYTAIGSVFQSGKAFHWSAGPVASGSTTITVTFSALINLKAIVVREITGCSAVQSAHAEAGPSTPGTGTDAVSSGTLTPTSQPALISGLCLDTFFGATPAAGTGFTSSSSAPLIGKCWDWGDGVGNSYARIENQRVTSTSAVAATFTSSAGASNKYCVLAAAFTEAAAGAAQVLFARPQIPQPDPVTDILPPRRLLAQPKPPTTAYIAQEVTAQDPNGSTSGTTIAATFTVAAGSYLHVWGSSLSFVPSACSDSLNGSYGAAKDNGSFASQFSLGPSLGGLVTVTLTFPSATTVKSIWVMELRNVAGLGPHTVNDQASSGTGSDNATSGNVTPTVQPALVVGLCMNATSNATIPSAGTGFTAGPVSWSFPAEIARSESKRITALTPLAATFGTASSVSTETFAAIYTEAGATSVLTPMRRDAVATNWTAWAPPDTPFLLEREVIQPAAGVAVFQPSNRAAQGQQLPNVEPQPALYFFGMRSAGIQPGSSQVDNPPPGAPQRLDMLVAVQSWDPPPYAAQSDRPSALIQPPPPVVNNPPGGWPAYLAEAVERAAWEPVPNAPQPPRRLAQPGAPAAPKVPTPDDVAMLEILAMWWEPAAPAPQSLRRSAITKVPAPPNTQTLGRPRVAVDDVFYWVKP